LEQAYLGRVFRLDVTGEVVEDRLPATALLLDAVRGFAVEGDPDCNAVGTGREVDLGGAVADAYSISLFGTILVYVPAKLNPMLPSFASMREENLPPSRRSTEAAVVCQSSDAAFHALISSGVV